MWVCLEIEKPTQFFQDSLSFLLRWTTYSKGAFLRTPSMILFFTPLPTPTDQTINQPTRPNQPDPPTNQPTKQPSNPSNLPHHRAIDSCLGAVQQLCDRQLAGGWLGGSFLLCFRRETNLKRTNRTGQKDSKAQFVLLIFPNSFCLFSCSWPIWEKSYSLAWCRDLVD